MSERDDFLDILGNIDDDIIAESAVIKREKPQGIIKRIVTVSAAVFLFIISAVIIKNGFFDTGYILPSENPLSSEDSPDNNESITDTSDGITEIPSENKSVTDVPSSELLTDPPTVLSPYEEPSDSPTVLSPYEEPSESQTVLSPYEEPSEPSSSENELPTEDISTTGDGSQGILGGEDVSIFFNEVSAGELIYGSTDSLPDEYPITEKTDISTLQKIYGTKIIPSYIPEINIVYLLSETINKEYFVYYNEDKTEVYCKNLFTFLLNNGGILRITASTHPLPLLDVESENYYMTSDIADIPVLLFKGLDSEIISIYSAYFQKDGCYFRVQLSEKLLSERKFINIIEALI